MADQFTVNDASWRWVDARKAFNVARDRYDAAREMLQVARIELAETHKKACELNPGREHMFAWFDDLYGDRDQILAAASAKEQANG